MAYRIFSGSVEREEARVNLVVASNGETIIFTRSASYVASGNLAHVLKLGRGATLNIDGALYSGNGSAIWAASPDGAFEARVGASGIVSSGSAAFDIKGTSFDLVNRGYVAGNVGLLSGAQTSTILNLGTIAGRTAVSIEGAAVIDNQGEIASTVYGIYATGAGEKTITNSGSIGGTQGIGIFLFTAADVLIINHGSITGRTGISLAAATYAEAATRTIDNFGTISGKAAAIVGSTARDVITNSGTIAGSVYLGAGNDLFDGSDGRVSKTVYGEAGDDTIIGSLDRKNTLSGGAGNDILYGGNRDDVLMPGSGADVLYGGDGTDIASFRDRTDNIRFLMPFDGESYQGIQFHSIEGLEGGSGNDYLFANSLDNILIGNAGDDELVGGFGNDTMIGGIGNDLYSVQEEGDLVIEYPDEGIDTIAVYFDYSMPDNVENLTLMGAASNALGNSLANVIRGTQYNNTIRGGDGIDTLYGGGGNDNFDFRAPPGAASADIIMDFTSGDHVNLSVVGFTAFKSPYVADSQFRVGSAALDADDFLVYNPANRTLYYDPDANGSAAMLAIASFLGTSVAPTAADISLSL